MPTGLSFKLIGFLVLVHVSLPSARPYTAKCLTLSHYNPSTGNYAIGRDDYYFILFWIVLLTGLRAGCMEYAIALLWASYVYHQTRVGTLVLVTMDVVDLVFPVSLLFPFGFDPTNGHVAGQMSQVR